MEEEYEYIVPDDVKQKNRELCDKYPFLIPSNVWSGMKITEAQDGGYWPGSPEEIPEYDYEYTWLDDMPEGWRIAFGEQLCDDLKEERVRAGCLDKYRIIQIKEKYVSLRWYDSGCTEKWYTEILPKYEAMSYRTCIKCGKPATRISTGWICPWCDECAKDITDRFVLIDEWFKPVNIV